MSLYLRLLTMIFKLLINKTTHDPCKPLECSFHVLVTDLDFNGHMTNSRYASFIDLVRLKFMIQVGLLDRLKQLGAIPVLGATYTRFRRDLKPFSKFTVKMEIVYMSPRWIYFDYKFIKDGFVHCHSLEKWGGSIHGEGMISPNKLIPGAKEFTKPPAHIAKIMDVEDEMRVIVRKEP